MKRIALAAATIVFASHFASAQQSYSISVKDPGTLEGKGAGASVFGKISCGVVYFANICVNLAQKSGHKSIMANDCTSLQCNGGDQPWKILVFARDGLFKKAPTAVKAYAFICDDNFCGMLESTGSIMVK